MEKLVDFDYTYLSDEFLKYSPKEILMCIINSFAIINNLQHEEHKMFLEGKLSGYQILLKKDTGEIYFETCNCYPFLQDHEESMLLTARLFFIKKFIQFLMGAK